MDNLEIAKALFQQKSATKQSSGQTTTAYGTAMSDSSSGAVMVNLGGDTVSPDDDQMVELETTFAVKEGDEVIVSLVGADGTGKAPVVTGVVGRGDETEAEIEAIKNYFWTDEYGAHVSTEEQSVQGANVLLDSDSLDIRYGNSNSESDQTVYASFGREVTVGTRDDGNVGTYSQVYGRQCVAAGDYSKASGFNTIAGSDYQTVIGRNNVEDSSDQYALIVGNGEYPSEKETFTTDGQTTSFTLEQAPQTITSLELINQSNSNPLSVAVQSNPDAVREKRFYVSSAPSVDLPCRVIDRVQGASYYYYAVIPAGSQYSEYVAPAVVGAGTGEVSTDVYAPYFNERTIQVPHSVSGNVITLTGAAAYWATQLSGLKLKISYDYLGTVTRSNAMTVDWDGNLSVAGKLSAGVGFWKELWTNSDPTSNFAAQTVFIDLSAYSVIAIELTANTNNNGNRIELCKVGNISILQAQNFGSSQYVYMRKATVSTLGVTFTIGYRNTTGTTGAGYCIPVAIYGVC